MIELRPLASEENENTCSSGNTYFYQQTYLQKWDCKGRCDFDACIDCVFKLQ